MPRGLECQCQPPSVTPRIWPNNPRARHHSDCHRDPQHLSLLYWKYFTTRNSSELKLFQNMLVVGGADWSPLLSSHLSPPKTTGWPGWPESQCERVSGSTWAPAPSSHHRQASRKFSNHPLWASTTLWVRAGESLVDIKFASQYNINSV